MTSQPGHFLFLLSRVLKSPDQHKLHWSSNYARTNCLTVFCTNSIDSPDSPYSRAVWRGEPLVPILWHSYRAPPTVYIAHSHIPSTRYFHYCYWHTRIHFIHRPPTIIVVLYFFATGGLSFFTDFFCYNTLHIDHGERLVERWTVSHRISCIPVVPFSWLSLSTVAHYRICFVVAAPFLCIPPSLPDATKETQLLATIQCCSAAILMVVYTHATNACQNAECSSGAISWPVMIRSPCRAFSHHRSVDHLFECICPHQGPPRN